MATTLIQRSKAADLPYTMRFSDGRTLVVEVPGRMVVRDRGGEVGIDKLAVSRWELGKLKPGQNAIQRIQRLRQKAVRRGVPLAG